VIFGGRKAKTRMREMQPFPQRPSGRAKKVPTRREMGRPWKAPTRQERHWQMGSPRIQEKENLLDSQRFGEIPMQSEKGL
jgi:hypothetical protein